MALSKNAMIYIAGFAVIAIFVIAVLLAVPGEFGGSDDSGGSTAEDYGYEPWTGNWMENMNFELPGETESFLFAVQAAIGAIIIGYFIGMNSARKKLTSDENAEEA